MKTFETCYKVTTKACQSCLMAYPTTTLEVKQFLALSYSTATWTIPNVRLNGSGIFVCKTLEQVKNYLYLNKDSLHGDYMVWEAIGMNVRKQNKFIVLGSSRTIEHLTKFWNFKMLDFLKSIGVSIRDSRRKGYYIADAVKLTRQVDI